MIFRDKKSTVIVVHQFSEEQVVGDVATGLQQVMVAQEFREGLEVFIRGDHRCRHPAFMGVIDALLHLLADTLLRGMTVQRVMDAHPVHGVEAVLTQLLIAQHLLTQVADFHIEHPVVQLLQQRGEHLTEQFFAGIATLGIDTFA